MEVGELLTKLEAALEGTSWERFEVKTFKKEQGGSFITFRLKNEASENWYQELGKILEFITEYDGSVSKLYGEPGSHDLSVTALIKHD